VVPRDCPARLSRIENHRQGLCRRAAAWYASRTCRPPRAPGTQAISPMVHLSAGEAWRERTPFSRHGPRGVTVCARGVLPPARVQKNSHGEKSQCAKVVACTGGPVYVGSAKRLCQEPGAGHGRGDECADVPMEQRAGRRLHQQVETIETADVRTGRNRAAETTIPGDGTLRDGRKKPHPCVSASR